MTQLQNNGVHVTQLAEPTGALCEKQGNPRRLDRVTFGGVRLFTKKPVTISAIQWTGKNLREVITFTDGPPDTRTTHAGMAWEAYADLVARDGLKIYTLEGKMLASPGDWIIRGVKGEFYPCKPDIFEATYSPAALAAAGQAVAQPASHALGSSHLRRGALMQARGAKAVDFADWLVTHYGKVIKEHLQGRGNLAREDLEYLMEKTAAMRDERLKQCIAELLAWGDAERAEVETFCAIALEVMRNTPPSRLRSAAMTVELKTLMASAGAEKGNA